jgi:hypothetical protein
MCYEKRTTVKATGTSVRRARKSPRSIIRLGDEEVVVRRQIERRSKVHRDYRFLSGLFLRAEDR